MTPLGGGKGMVASHVPNSSVPDGDRYILMFGATGPHVFMQPAPAEFHASLPAADQKMLAMRRGERVNIMLEEATVLGPAAGHKALTPSAGIQLGSFNCATYKDELEHGGAWTRNDRFPSLEHVPGCDPRTQTGVGRRLGQTRVLLRIHLGRGTQRTFPFYQKSNPQMEAESQRIVGKLVHAPKLVESRAPHLAAGHVTQQEDVMQSICTFRLFRHTLAFRRNRGRRIVCGGGARAILSVETDPAGRAIWRRAAPATCSRAPWRSS